MYCFYSATCTMQKGWMQRSNSSPKSQAGLVAGVESRERFSPFRIKEDREREHQKRESNRQSLSHPKRCPLITTSSCLLPGWLQNSSAFKEQETHDLFIFNKNAKCWRPVAWELRRHQACWSLGRVKGWLWLPNFEGDSAFILLVVPYDWLYDLADFPSSGHGPHIHIFNSQVEAMKVNESGWVHGTWIRAAMVDLSLLPPKSCREFTKDFTTFIANCKMSQASLLERVLSSVAKIA